MADADAAAGRAGELGGIVIRPAWDTPYGRMSIVLDNQNAAFALMSMAQAAAQ